MKAAVNPWMKFYPSDWRADAMLRLCSIGARGLWTEMMCLMHEAEPYGSLLVNGKRIDKKQLAGLAGIPERDCTALLMELELNGVFSRDEDGTIYSRRMRRDFEKAVKDKNNGKKGGNPQVKGGVNPPVNGEVKAQKPEARDQNPEKRETRAGALVDDGWPAEYREQFWDRYPNKVGKPKALAKLDLARRRGVSFDDIMAGLEAYIRSKPPDRAWLNPETFINQERWNDQPATVNHAAAKSGTSLLDALDRAIDQSVAEDAHFAAPAHPVRLISH